MSVNQKALRRVGIYAGAFDPIHTGHIAFALQALAQAELDEVVFVPERRPRSKPGVEHFGHRVAMLRRALRPHSRLSLVELVDAACSVRRTLPQLRRQFGADTQLVLLVGSDVLADVPGWPDTGRLLNQVEMAVNIRAGGSAKTARQQVATWPVQPKALTICQSYAAAASSSQIRAALAQGRTALGLLSSVLHYTREHWLYVRLPG